MFAGLLVLWVIDGRIKKEQVLHALMAAIIAWGATQMIKSVIPTSRPYVKNGRQELTLTVHNDNSFPSSHAAIAFGIATTVWLHDKKWGGAFLASALLIGTGRILGNVHYPLDILGGGIIGIITALALERTHFPLDT
jgi:undecaprenyl-diphosphatase